MTGPYFGRMTYVETDANDMIKALPSVSAMWKVLAIQQLVKISLEGCVWQYLYILLKYYNLNFLLNNTSAFGT